MGKIGMGGLTLLILWLIPSQLLAAVWDAVVRVPSHGGSGTVVATGKGYTYILSCAHMFQGKQRTAPIKLDVPAPKEAPRLKGCKVTLVAVDYTLDLSLIKLDRGPLVYVCPVAGTGFKPSPKLLSVGYDEMKGPEEGKGAMRAWATIKGVDGDMTYTNEAPWHGRSGGALLDVDAKKLLGVVHGYTFTRCPYSPQRQPKLYKTWVMSYATGMYVSHSAVLKFLQKQGWTIIPDQKVQGREPPRFQKFVPIKSAPPPCPS